MEKIYKCPNCNMTWSIVEINCGIFRCGYYKQTWTQIPPHLDEKSCLALSNIIWGCGKPMQLNKETDELVICEYI